MAVQLSFHGQLSMLNGNIESLNAWLDDEVGVDYTFATLHFVGDPSPEAVAEMVDTHRRKFERFKRRLQRNTDLRRETLRQHTRPVEFDLVRIRSLFTETESH